MKRVRRRRNCVGAWQYRNRHYLTPGYNYLRSTMPIRCEIVSQDRMVFEGDADIVIVPGTEGEMGILPNHAPLLSTLEIWHPEGAQPRARKKHSPSPAGWWKCSRRSSPCWRMRPKMSRRSMWPGQKPPGSGRRNSCKGSAARYRMHTWRWKLPSAAPTCAWKPPGATAERTYDARSRKTEGDT